MSWYCPLPYTSLSSDPLGRYALCCESMPSPHHCDDMTLSQFKNSDYMKNVQNGFKLDNPLSVPEIKEACHQCKLKEDQGTVSKRQRELQDLRSDVFMELKLIGNICNYACLMCHPLSSSKIAEEVSIFVFFFESGDGHSLFSQLGMPIPISSGMWGGSSLSTVVGTLHYILYTVLC